MQQSKNLSFEDVLQYMENGNDSEIEWLSDDDNESDDEWVPVQEDEEYVVEENSVDKNAEGNNSASTNDNGNFQPGGNVGSNKTKKGNYTWRKVN